MTRDELRRNAGLKVCAATTIDLEHVDSQAAFASLRPWFAMTNSSLQLSTLGDTPSLLLRGFPDELLTAIRLIEEADRPPNGAGASFAAWRQQVDQRLAELESRK